MLLNEIFIKLVIKKQWDKLYEISLKKNKRNYVTFLFLFAGGCTKCTNSKYV